MTTIITNGAIRPSTLDTPTDDRTRIAALNDITTINVPFIGMHFYVTSTGNEYVVKSLKSKIVNSIAIPNAEIDTYEKINNITSVTLNGNTYVPYDGIIDLGAVDTISISEIKTTQETGFYVTDSQNKILFKYDSNGFDSAVVSTHFKLLIGNASTETSLPDWTGIKFYFIGDSITASSTSSTFYHAWLNTWTGLTAYNGGVSGDKLTGNMATRILNAGTDVDVVTVFGGTNDWSSNVTLGDPTTSTANDGTVCGGVKYIINCHRTRNGVKPILFFSPIPRATSYGDIGMNNTAGYSLYDLKEVVKKVCNNESVPFLDQFDNCLIKPWVSQDNTAFFYNADGLHPNADGHKQIAWNMMRFLSNYITNINI